MRTFLDILGFSPLVVFDNNGNSGGGSSDSGSSSSGGGSSSSASTTANTTVKKGDSLSQIAAANNTSVAAIVAANPGITNVNKINVGQKLKIPKNTGESTYAAGIGAGGSGAVTHNKDGSISVATGTKDSTEFRPSDDPMSVSAVVPVKTTVTTKYKPGQASNQASKTGSGKTGSGTSTTTVPPKDGGDKKPNFLGYGYYNRDGVWIPPDIDMIDGGGKGISGQVYGSSGGVDADKDFGNNDGYVTAAEAAAAAEAGKFKYGIGSMSNAVGATPYGSGIDPTGIAGMIHGDAMETPLFGPGVSMTQSQVDDYMADVTKRSQEAMANQQRIMNESDDGPASTEVVAAEPEDPCPEGYMMDPTTKQCVLDPFKTPFPDPVTGGGGAVVPAGLTPYTQMAPVSLAQLQPSRVANANPLAMQQAQMPQGGLGSLSAATSRIS